MFTAKNRNWIVYASMQTRVVISQYVAKPVSKVKCEKIIPKLLAVFYAYSNQSEIKYDSVHFT